MAKNANHIQSHINKDLQGPKNKARQRLQQLNAKCHNLKDDTHWKAVRVLCKTYYHIMIPKFHCQ